MRTLRIFTTLLLILSGIHCDKKPTTPVTPDIKITLDTEGLKYIQLTRGKYFIYKDSASGSLDSVVVTKSTLLSQYDPGDPSIFGHRPYYIEIYSLDLTSFGPGGTSIWFSAATTDVSQYYTTSQSNYRIDFRESNNKIALIYPIWPTPNPPSRLISSVTVEGKVYTNVMETIDFNAMPITNPNYSRNVFWWAKGVGLIRMERGTSTTTKTYTLVRNN